MKAAHKAVELGANCFQIFSASPRMWRATAPEAAQVALMKAARAEHGRDEQRGERRVRFHLPPLFRVVRQEVGVREEDAGDTARRLAREEGIRRTWEWFREFVFADR